MPFGYKDLRLPTSKYIAPVCICRKGAFPPAQVALWHLTMLIQALLSTAACQDCSSDPIAPAWDGHTSTGGSSDIAFQAVHRRSTDERMAPHTPKKNTDMQGNREGTNEPHHHQPGSPAPEKLSDISAGTQELEKARRSDLQADQSHVRELRALVAEFVHKGRGGSREGYMAELLVEVGARGSW